MPTPAIAAEPLRHTPPRLLLPAMRCADIRLCFPDAAARASSPRCVCYASTPPYERYSKAEQRKRKKERRRCEECRRVPARAADAMPEHAAYAADAAVILVARAVKSAHHRLPTAQQRFHARRFNGAVKTLLQRKPVHAMNTRCLRHEAALARAAPRVCRAMSRRVPGVCCCQQHTPTSGQARQCRSYAARLPLLVMLPLISSPTRRRCECLRATSDTQSCALACRQLVSRAFSHAGTSPPVTTETEKVRV